MFPTSTIANLLNGFCRHVTQTGQSGSGYAFIQQCFNSADLRNGQFGIPNLFASKLRSIFVPIFSILFWRAFVEVVRITAKTVAASMQDPLKWPFSRCKPQSNTMSEKDLTRNTHFPISRSIDISLRLPTFCGIIRNGYLFLKSYPQFFFRWFIITTSQAALIASRTQHQGLIIYRAIARFYGAFHINSITQEMAN